MRAGEQADTPPDEADDKPFDHYSAEYVDDHIEMLAEIRERCPVKHSPLHGGFFVVTKYDDVAAVARDDATFSSEWTEDETRGITIPGRPDRHSFIEMDPPQSTMFRKAFLPFFSPASVKARNHKRQQFVREAIDEVIETGHFDIVLEFSDRIPGMTTLDMLGLPMDNWHEVVSFFHHYTSAPADDRSTVDSKWLLKYIQEAIDDRRQNPREDGLTWIMNQPVGGTPLSDPDLVEAIMLILVGGFDTTSALLSNTFLYLSDHPEDRDRLIADPSLLESACEEFLRFYSPVLSLGRNVMKDCTLGGQELHEGDHLLLAWIAANHDPAQFPNPEEVILDRFPNRHQAFGLGSHRCVGSTMARENFYAAVSEVLTRIPDYRVLKDKAIRYPSLSANNGWFSMPVEFTPGKRSDAGGAA